MKNLFCLLLFGVLPGVAHALIQPGIYYDRSRNGHGVGLVQAGEVIFGALFTYDRDGEPTWYYIQTNNGEAPTGSLTRQRIVGGQVQIDTVGSYRLSATSSCADGSSRPGARQLTRFEFSVSGINQNWCIEQLLPTETIAASALNGAWYQPSTTGWGLLNWYIPGAGLTAASAFQALFFNDGNGEPRWAIAQSALNSLDATYDFGVLQNSSCLYCDIGGAQPRSIGNVRVRLISTQANNPQNQLQINLRYGNTAPFQRAGAVTLLSQPNPVAGVASTREGLVQGVIDAEGISSFRKIPYVASPVGALRWRAPQPAMARAQVLNATQFGSGCPQPVGQAFFSGAPQTQSEDCLQLNIWRPAAPGPHPVMVWIHGGGLVIGSAVDMVNGTLVYAGNTLARRNTVVVSINYRLGPLGYLALRDFNGEFPDHPSSGNYGLLDQTAALRWVRENVAAFGGDPENVTIFGESAGGVSVCALLAAPAARGLFHRAIAQSGNCRNSVPSLATSQQQGDRVLANTSCANASDRRACLRSLSSAQILSAGQPTLGTGAGQVTGESYGLNLDGFVLAETPGAAIVEGRAAAVPFILGVNDDEQTSLSPSSTLPATVEGYESAVRTAFGITLGGLALARYPASAYASPQAAYQDLIDDVRFTCANRRAAADHAARGNPVFHYVLTEILPDPQLRPLESFHGLDVILLFGPRTQAQTLERAVSEQMQRAFVQFARTGDPGNALGFSWPRYSASDRRSVEFNGATLGLIPDYRGSFCQFWATYVAL